MRTIIAAAAVLVLALLPVAAPWLQFVLTLAIAKGFAALGVAVLLRAGLISIGHAMFFAASAYGVAFLARAGINDLALLLILSVLAGALVGVVAGSFLVRYRAIFFAMLNLAVSMVASGLSETSRTTSAFCGTWSSARARSACSLNTPPCPRRGFPPSSINPMLC